MISIGANGNKIAYGIKSFNLDEFSDFQHINVKNLKPGSTAFVIATSKTYMLNNKYIWIEINKNSSSNIEPDDFYDPNGDGYPDYDGGSIEDSNNT